MTRTRTVLKRASLLALATMALSSLSFATIICGSGQTVTALATAGGCTLGTNTFTNFSLLGSSRIGGSPDAIDPNMVQLSFTGASSNPGVVNVILSGDTDAASWTASGGSQFTLNLTYTVTGNAPYFSAFADSLTATSIGAGAAVSYDKGANGQMLATLNGTSSNGPLTFAGGPLTTFNVQDNIQAHSGNSGGTATLTNATNSFTMVSIVTTAPEPMTSMLLGSGLLAFGFMLRRRKRS